MVTKELKRQRKLSAKARDLKRAEERQYRIEHLRLWSNQMYLTTKCG